MTAITTLTKHWLKSASTWTLMYRRLRSCRSNRQCLTRTTKSSVITITTLCRSNDLIISSSKRTPTICIRIKVMTLQVFSWHSRSIQSIYASVRWQRSVRSVVIKSFSNWPTSPRITLWSSKEKDNGRSRWSRTGCSTISIIYMIWALVRKRRRINRKFLPLYHWWMVEAGTASLRRPYHTPECTKRSNSTWLKLIILVKINRKTIRSSIQLLSRNGNCLRGLWPTLRTSSGTADRSNDYNSSKP